MEAAAVSNKIRVLIADDHRLFAETLEALLATEDRVEVVGSARDGKEAVRLARKAGAAGYVTKDRIAAELIEAIVEVANR